MLEYDELKVEFEGYEPELKELAGALDLDNLKTEIAKLEEQSAQPDFWNDVENSQKISQKIGEDKNIVQSYEKLRESYDDVMTMLELAQEEDDESMLPEIQELAKHFRTELESQKLATLLSGEFDHNNAILTFHAGAGGTEAQDWVEMLYRMYNHWAEQHGMKVTVLDYLDGEEAGIKSASILVEGRNAYGYLKSENGVHRLVRVSPFDSSGRRHTSFASVEVMPEINEDIDIEISEDEIKMDVYRASGAGGQHIEVPFPQIGRPFCRLLLMGRVANEHQVMVGHCPQTVDDLSGVQSHTAVTGHKELRHTILAQHHDLLRQFDFQFSAAVVFLVKAPRKTHGVLPDDRTTDRLVHILLPFSACSSIFLSYLESA